MHGMACVSSIQDFYYNVIKQKRNFCLRLNNSRLLIPFMVHLFTGLTVHNWCLHNLFGYFFLSSTIFLISFSHSLGKSQIIIARNTMLEELLNRKQTTNQPI